MPADDAAEATTGQAAALNTGAATAPATEENEWPTVPPRVVGLCFRKGGKVYYFHPGDFPVRVGDFVVVETDRGVDIGEVVSLKPTLEPGEEEPTKRLVRLATPSDVRKKQALTEKEQRAFRTCQQKIREHGLQMKLIDAGYTLDGRRLTFSFVSEGRVDFRELVKDLAHTFRCRIELRQVGVRDQAKLIGGLGPCGRPLCCATFLRDFTSVGIRLAKDQGLSLNPAKISGACDRLMCCLRYEHAQYVEMNKRLPKVGALVEAAGVKGEVVERNLLVGAVKNQDRAGAGGSSDLRAAVPVRGPGTGGSCACQGERGASAKEKGPPPTGDTPAGCRHRKRRLGFPRGAGAGAAGAGTCRSARQACRAAAQSNAQRSAQARLSPPPKETHPWTRRRQSRTGRGQADCRWT